MAHPWGILVWLVAEAFFEMRMVAGLEVLLGKLAYQSISSSFTAELWALRDGLLLCHQRNAQVVAVELDARAIVDAFNHQTNSNTIVSSIMDDCRYLVNQIP